MEDFYNFEDPQQMPKKQQPSGNDEANDFNAFDSSGAGGSSSSNIGGTTGDSSGGSGGGGYDSSATSGGGGYDNSGGGGGSSAYDSYGGAGSYDSYGGSSSYDSYGGSGGSSYDATGGSGSAYDTSGGSAYDTSGGSSYDTSGGSAYDSYGGSGGSSSSYDTGSYGGSGGSTGSSSYSYHAPGKFSKFLKKINVKVPLFPTLIMASICIYVGMVCTAYMYQVHPESIFTNCCRLSIRTTKNCCFIMINLYHGRLGEIPPIVCATDEDDDSDLGEDEIERMKPRPKLEDALGVEHEKCMTRTAESTSMDRITGGFLKSRGDAEQTYFGLKLF
eukprot:CAMPEP_0194134014 /NCGR_PEP_ID=MMETSP0152-20130528/4078_1 /TAXON_ID=1049557 /ORGANISM="Thalassiothrix antarctica, Strain L6-D1" /LENGTH=330 /DNA_ID=CAMNT_0038829527 /DNA_START=240 /DNA_END=1232 /DNA_ORIENTATION=-